ncbi:hypothetical protein PVT01_030026800 [Plasmodium vivax]|uniref:VIR protein n=1 Tax=Plasmodium vivax TaxID=5855 RepID=A0A1G4GS95_PLAVI|nr:hypothetical protein PVT01_030026800 [Plasmodium vivax]
MKLIRNLGHYYVDDNYFDPTFERCDILYNWLYHSSKNEKNLDDIIEKCFIDYKDQMNGKNRDCKCSYDSYKNMYLDPMKINILKIFNNNIEILRQILIGTDDSKKTLCGKFVCKCLKIYKDMNETYCFTHGEQSPKQKNTCLELYLFSSAYNIFHNMLVGIDPKIPSIYETKKEILDKCEPYENTPANFMLADGNSHGHQHSREDQGRTGPSFSGDINGENKRSSASSTVSTALGTVAGASSLLALLYKFSPGRNWIRSGFRGGRSRINSNLYAEGPSELLFDGMENNGFNSYSIGYEAI